MSLLYELFTGKGNKIETSSQHLVQGADMISMDGFDCGGHPGRGTRTQPGWPVSGASESDPVGFPVGLS